MIKNLLRSKDGKFSPAVINAAIFGLIILVVLFTIYSVLIPEAQTAGDSMNISNKCVADGCFYNATDSPNASIAGIKCLASQLEVNSTCATQPIPIPLAGLFSSTGVVFVIIMGALIILVVRAYLKKQK